MSELDPKDELIAELQAKVRGLEDHLAIANVTIEKALLVRFWTWLWGFVI